MSPSLQSGERMSRVETQDAYLEFIGAGDGHRSPLLRTQLERSQNGSLILRLPDINALAAIRKADVARIGA
jgi:hypothetical protein